MNSDWAELSCEVPTEMVDPLADFLIELSGNGVSIDNLELDTFSLDALQETPTKTVKGFFPSDPSLDEQIAAVTQFLRTEGPAFPGFVFKAPLVRIIRDEDWANNWKQHFKPVRIGKRMVIKPTWEEYAPVAGDIVLEIDPGMAFGTGAHPTTRMCLEVLELLCFHEPPYGDNPAFALRRLLDVGTGSGVLSIAACKMGGESVVAIDIDPEAVRVTRENMELNLVGDRVAVSTTPLAAVEGTFQIVVANILAEELVRLAPELCQRVAGGGFLILSGILVEKEELVIAGFLPHGLKLRQTVRDGEWSCLAYARE